MKSLTDIANQYGTDKGTLGPSLTYGAHNYTDIYEAYLSRYRQNPVNILEIGIGVDGDRWNAYIVHGRNKTGGASLKMWKDYFPRGEIFGIDINSAKHFDSERIHTFVIDQGNRQDIQNFIKKIKNIYFDFIFDDGSHRPDHQQISLGFLFPRLKPKGIYFIEDLEKNGLGDKGGKRNKGRHNTNLTHNTRKILRTFFNTGRFLTPNCLGDTSYLKEQISTITFHAPLNKIILPNICNGLLGKRSMMIQYKIGTERLCAIHKK